MSETAASREVLAPYCIGRGLDIGYGGSKVVPHFDSFDLPNNEEDARRLGLPQRYTTVGEDPQDFQGDCRDLRVFCSGSRDVLYSAHLLEDFTYHELATVIIPEWRRVLRSGGLLVTNCPDQQRFLNHCYKTGQGINYAHKEADFSIENFEKNVLGYTGPWECVERVPEHGAYSWCLVVRKV